VIELLLDAGANPELTNSRGSSPLSCASFSDKNRKTKLTKIFENHRLLKTTTLKANVPNNVITSNSEKNLKDVDRSNSDEEGLGGCR